MIDPRQFRELVIRPVLAAAGLWSQSAENLLLGTALVESGLTYLTQHNGGPARGVFQMEPATHDWLWTGFILPRPPLVEAIRRVTPAALGRPSADEMIGNLRYATLIARINYRRTPAALPAADDIDGLAAYWKDHWNTRLGAGRPEQFVRNWTKHAA